MLTFKSVNKIEIPSKLVKLCTVLDVFCTINVRAYSKPRVLVRKKYMLNSKPYMLITYGESPNPTAKPKKFLIKIEIVAIIITNGTNFLLEKILALMFGYEIMNIAIHTTGGTR